MTVYPFILDASEESISLGVVGTASPPFVFGVEISCYDESRSQVIH